MKIQEVINEIKFPITQCYVHNFKKTPSTEYTLDRLNSWDDIYDALEVTDKKETIIDFEPHHTQRGHLLTYLMIGTPEDISSYKSYDLYFDGVPMVLTFYSYAMPFEKNRPENKGWNIRYVRYDK